ncbi:MAG TPA: pyridoxamine 5'-phosphate oxidase [Solirubrobacteraceae bacterium]|nr:pyridoxamine 5'-phosphate oxidase [Solirubrobacteraceae bacterium]
MTDFAQPLREENVAADPYEQFARWFAEAGQAGVRAPEAAAVATADADGAPSVRMVLVKHTEAPGFVFFSNYESRKGGELRDNPRAAILFYWDVLGRQVRLEGPVERTSAEETAAYVRSRPRASQLSALASHQSRPVASREDLERRVRELTDRFAGDDGLPVPDFWGGYRLRPQSFEFWQHREDRLHDRLLYTPSDGDRWRLARLSP